MKVEKKVEIYPFLLQVGFKTSRIYWSFRNLNKKCRYMCRIDDNEGAPCFVIKVIEDGMKDLVLRDNTAKGNKGYSI